MAQRVPCYFDTFGASNGGTEAINGLIELHRRIARGFRNLDNYRSGCSSSAEACSYNPIVIGEDPVLVNRAEGQTISVV